MLIFHEDCVVGYTWTNHSRYGGTIDTLKIARCGYSHKLYVVNQMLFVDNVSFSTTGFSFLQSNCMDGPDDTFAIQIFAHFVQPKMFTENVKLF